MRTKSLYFVTLVFLASLFSCGPNLDLMKKNAENIDYEVNPYPLEMRNEKVSFSVNGQMPSEYFNKKATMEIKPVLVYETGETEMEPIVLQGEKVKDNNTVIKVESGGSFDYSQTFAYKDKMRLSQLEVRISASIGDESVDFTPVKIADGIMTTQRLVQYGFDVDNIEYKTESDEAAKMNSGAKLSIATVTLPDKSTSTYQADIHYQIERSRVQREELNEEDVQNFVESVKKAVEDELVFKGITISSYASPDGPWDLNERLSENRGKSAKRFVEDEVDDMELEASEESYSVKPTTEDWEGFKEELQKSDIKNKDLILRVLNMYDDPQVREREIKNMAEAFTELADEVLPKLRRSKISAMFETSKKTDEEIKTLASESPELLDSLELFYAGSLTDNPDEKIAIYQKCIELYPNDWKAYNNLGVVYMYKSDVKNAQNAFESAISLEENEITLNNMGALQLQLGDDEKAEEYFSEAINKGATKDINYNMGYLFIKKGKYSQAVKYFGESCSFNAALAMLLNKDAQGALKKLNCMVDAEKDHPMYYYLKAIAGARLEKEDVVLNNLREAVKRNDKVDIDVKDYAKHDVEFKDYFEREEFKGIVE